MKKKVIILLAGITVLTACQSRQITQISNNEELPTLEVDGTDEADTSEAPAVPTEEVTPSTVEASSAEKEPPAFRVKQVVLAAIDEYFREWETREDGSAVTEYTFNIDDDMLLMHDGNVFIVCAGFTVLPEKYEWESWGAYSEPGEDGRITDSRFFSIKREGAEYHVTDVGTGAFHRPYSDLVAGITAGEKPDEFSYYWFCPAEAAEYVLTERLEQAKQDAQHPISDFSFEVYSDTVMSEGDGSFSIYATIRVLPANTDAANTDYWTGANGGALDSGWIESYRCYSLKRENGVFKIIGTGTGMGSTQYLSDEWNSWWS